MATTFCALCQHVVDNIFVRSSYQPAETDPSGSLSSYTRIQRFPHLPRNQDLVSSSQRCSLCSLIQDALYNRYSQSPRDHHSVQDFQERWLCSADIGLEARGGNPFRMPGESEDGLQLCNLYIGTIHGYCLGELLSVYAEKGSPAYISGDVFGVGPLSDSSSDDCLSVVKNWVSECASHHRCGHLQDAACQTEEDSTLNPELPTRILEIGAESSGSMTIRLVESHGMRGRYAALSHCWGPPDKQPLRTLKANHLQHLAGIPPTDLPKTFREAAQVAHAVGLRYLWIDSLCIIQDDRDDWLQEAPRMGPLYGRAFLVIAASDATNSTEGCFVPRRSPGPSLRIPYPTAPGGEGKNNTHVLLQVRPPHTALSPAFSPLGRRGWVLQEWQLARRLVHFTAAGMTWSCKQIANMTEDGLHTKTNPTHTLQDTEAKDAWDDIIDSYTIRQLTFLSDKIIAVQGLADSMQRSPEDYHHGMWASDMPQQLFWVATHATRPKALQDIPSWSWASTDGRCLTLARRQLSWETLPATITVEHGKELVVSCRARRCFLRRWREFSHAVAGEAPLARAAVPGSVMWDLPIHFTRKVVHLVVDDDTGEEVGLAMLDDVGAAGEGMQGCVGGFLMREVRSSRQTQEHSLVHFGLVLQPVEGLDSGVYRRLGVGFVVDEGWVEGGAEQTFRVV